MTNESLLAENARLRAEAQQYRDERDEFEGRNILNKNALRRALAREQDLKTQLASLSTNLLHQLPLPPPEIP